MRSPAYTGITRTGPSRDIFFSCTNFLKISPHPSSEPNGSRAGLIQTIEPLAGRIPIRVGPLNEGLNLDKKHSREVLAPLAGSLAGSQAPRASPEQTRQ